MRNRTPTQVLENGAIRYAVYDADANFLRYEYLLPADEPTDPGTDLNANTLLKDATAAKFGKDNAAVPDDILSLLGDFLNTSAAKIAVGSYVGTDTYGADAPNRLTFDFAPDIVLISDDGGWTNGIGTNTTRKYLPNIAIRGQSSGFMAFFPTSGADNFTTIAWGSNYIEWYNAHSAYTQMNSKSSEYFYVAIGKAS